MKVQKEVFGNWDQYWAQATSVDIETKNDLFVFTKSIPVQPID